MTTNGPPDVTLAFYEDHKNTAPKVMTLPWLGLVELLSVHERTDCAPCPGGKKCQKKFGLAFSPAPPRYGETRGDSAVDFVSCLTYDFDHVTDAELQGVSDRVEGVEAILYSTHSHLWGGADDNCVRVAFSTSRAMKPDEYRVVHRHVRKKFQLEWLRPGEKKLSGADQNAKDLSRLYFMPSAPVGTEVLFAHSQGQPLDVDALISEVNRETVSAATGFHPPLHTTAPPEPAYVPPTNVTQDMNALDECLRAYVPPVKDESDEELPRKEVIRRVRYKEPLVRNEETSISRDRTVHRLAKILATKALPEGTPLEAVLELIRPSIMSMRYDGDGPDGSNSIEARFEKFKYSWARGLADRAEHNKKIAESRARDEEFQRRLHRRFVAQERTQQPAEEAADPDLEEDAEVDLEAPISFDGWEDGLVYVTNKDGSRSLKNVDRNAFRLLAYAPEWRAVLRRNEVTKDLLVVGGPPITIDRKDPTMAIKYWLQQKDLGLNLNTKDVMTSIVSAAKMNSFDPVRDYLLSAKSKWDVGSRADTFLEIYCGARTQISTDEDVDAEKEEAKSLVIDITTYVRMVSRRWLIGTAARGMKPGCKMDNVLILEGDQGIKKSTFLSILGGEWFADSQINITDKDSKMLAARSWLVEMPELSALRANETEAQKAFFSSRVDKFRPPYGAVIEEFPRRCVFVGSTNDDQYMHDITGNRRYWPIRCDGVKPNLLRRDRDQIWGEAVTLFLAGGAKHCDACRDALDGEDRCPAHRWWFSTAENKMFLESINDQRLKNDFADAVVDFVLRFGKEKRPRMFTMHQIAVDGLKFAPDRIAVHHFALGRTLKILGFKRKRVKEHGILSWRYETPKNLLAAATRAGGGINPKTGAPEPMKQANA